MNGRFWLALGLIGVGTSCATQHASTAWVDDSTLKYDRDQYKNAAAVVLFKEDLRLLQYNKRLESESQEGQHVVIAIQKEGALEEASIRVPYNASWNLIELRARVIDPDGKTREVPKDSILKNEEKKSDEHHYNAAYFQFPKVSPGSILEYAYSYQVPYLDASSSQETVGRFPVRKYHFQLTANEPVVLEAKEYNSDAPITVENLFDGSNRLSCLIHDIPERKVESYEPHRTYTEPRWAYRVTSIQQGSGYSFHWFHDWNDVFSGMVKTKLFDAKIYSGFALKLDERNCTTTECRLQKSLNLIEELRTSSDGWSTVRPLQTVFESGHATAMEKAFIVRKVLENVGISADLAFVAGPWNHQFDESFPSEDQLTGVLLYIPKQGDLSAPMLLDTRCFWCRAGEVREHILSTKIARVHADAHVIGNPEIHSEWIKATGVVAPTRKWKERQTFVIDGLGQAKSHLEGMVSGGNMESFGKYAEVEGADAVAKKHQSGISTRMPLSKLGEVDPSACPNDKRTCSFGFHYTVADFATLDKDSLFVPLQMTSTHWAGVFDSATRSADIHFPESSSFSETIEIQVPEGFHLVKTTALESQAAPGLEYKFVVTPVE